MPAKLRVLHLGSPTGLYGAERWILALIRNLDPELVESYVAVVRDDPLLKAPLCRDAEKFGFGTKIFEAQGRINFKAVRLIRKYINANKIDILHTHFYKTDIIGLFAAKGTSCKLITTPHGWSTRADFKLMLYEKMDRIIYPLFDAVVPLSPDIYDNLKKGSKKSKNLKLILNGVDLTEIYSQKIVTPELQKFKEDKKFIIGYIGQLIPRKGLDILLKAVSGISEFKWHMVVVGEGEQRSELERLSRCLKIDEKITYFGYRSDRLSFMKGLDLFVLPSWLEGVPRCLLEAMSMGVPVVATDIAGCRDIIQSGETGLLFQPGNSDELKKAILNVATRRIPIEDIKAAACKFVEKNYSAKRMAKEYQNLYKLLIGGNYITRKIKND